MGKNKLERFAEIGEFENVLECTDFENGEKEKPSGKWHSEIFENDHPIVLELACGKGTYTLELARRNPDLNIIGVDIKGARIWKGAGRALEQNLENVRFLRTYIDHLDEYFAPNEIDDIWITFPDPYPRGSDRDKRLTSPKFQAIYSNLLKPSGKIRLKTDSDQLFSYTKLMADKENCKVLDVVDDIYRDRPEDELLTIKTDFEKKHLQKGRTISYIEFQLPNRKGGQD